MENLHYTNPSYNKFVQEVRKGGWKPRHYNGRNFYAGPAVACEDWEEMQQVIRATTVTVQYDQLGKHGYIIYPR